MSSRQFKSPSEQRVVLTSLVLQIYQGIDKKRSGIAPFPAEDEHVAELTTHIVLADAIQYLQYLSLGRIISENARGYSFKEIKSALRRLMETHQSDMLKIVCRYDGNGAGIDSDTHMDVNEYHTFCASVQAVLAHMEDGIMPIEPIITYRKTPGSLSAFFGPPSD